MSWDKIERKSRTMGSAMRLLVIPACFLAIGVIGSAWALDAISEGTLLWACSLPAVLILGGAVLLVVHNFAYHQNPRNYR